MKTLHSITQSAAFRIRIIPFIIVLTLFFSVLIIAITPPETGYELSIYTAYPTFLWVIISINIFFSFYAIIRSCKSESKGLYYGYFSILFIETIIILLPIIRGYYSMNRGGGDIYYHLSIAYQILNTGHFPQTDTYPIMHIWLSILQNFSHDFILLTLVLSLIFLILYILSLYIFGKTIIGTKTGGIFVSIFGIPLIFSYCYYAFYPFFFASLMIPLILYLYQKIILNPKQKNSFYICLIFLSLFIVFCHPMVTIFLLVMFSTFAVYELFNRWNAISWRLKIVALNIVAIVSVTFSLWLFQFRSLLSTIQKIGSTLLGQMGYITIFEYQANLVTGSNASIWLIIDNFVKMYGSIFIYFLISLIFVIHIIYQYYRHKKLDKNDLIYSLQFCVATCIGIALITGYFVIFEPIRAVTYGLIFATIICGLFFYRKWTSILSEKQYMRFINSITLVITIVCILTMLGMYFSPWISSTNTALTYGDKNGIDWILEYRNEDIPIVRQDESLEQYLYYYISTNPTSPSKITGYNRIIPTHFGYFNNRTIGNAFAYLPNENVYMITTELMKVTPNAVPADRRYLVKTYTDTDFIRLNNDPTANLVHLGNEFAVWSIVIP